MTLTLNGDSAGAGCGIALGLGGALAIGCHGTVRGELRCPGDQVAPQEDIRECQAGSRLLEPPAQAVRVQLLTCSQLATLHRWNRGGRKHACRVSHDEASIAKRHERV